MEMDFPLNRLFLPSLPPTCFFFPSRHRYGGRPKPGISPSSWAAKEGMLLMARWRIEAAALSLRRDRFSSPFHRQIEDSHGLACIDFLEDTDNLLSRHHGKVLLPFTRPSSRSTTRRIPGFLTSFPGRLARRDDLPSARVFHCFASNFLSPGFRFSYQAGSPSLALQEIRARNRSPPPSNGRPPLSRFFFPAISTEHMRPHSIEALISACRSREICPLLPICPARFSS